MDRSKFYGALRVPASIFANGISQQQVNGLEALLSAAEMRGTNLQFLAYMMGTAYHETAHTMKPIEEYGHGKGRKYGVPAGPYGKVYFGRGWVQLTWLVNYQKASEEIGTDLVKSPERALELGNATLILFEGMEQGWFTGKRLADYIGTHGADYKNARRIINGTDKANTIAGYAVAFEKALRAAGYSSARTFTPVIVPPAPEPVQRVSPIPAPVESPKPPLVLAPAPVAGEGVFDILISLLAKIFGRKQQP